MRGRFLVGCLLASIGATACSSESKPSDVTSDIARGKADGASDLVGTFRADRFGPGVQRYAFLSDGTMMMQSQVTDIGPGGTSITRGSWEASSSRVVITLNDVSSVYDYSVRGDGLLLHDRTFDETSTYTKSEPFCEQVSDCYGQGDPPADAGWACENATCEVSGGYIPRPIVAIPEELRGTFRKRRSLGFGIYQMVVLKDGTGYAHASATDIGPGGSNEQRVTFEASETTFTLIWADGGRVEYDYTLSGGELTLTDRAYEETEVWDRGDPFCHSADDCWAQEDPPADAGWECTAENRCEVRGIMF